MIDGNMSSQPLLLCILDGFGINPNQSSNAVALAKKPNIDKLLAEWPSTTLVTYGERVGLPAGQMGNSEVGHLNIGAGRIVEQWLLKIERALKGDFLENSLEYNGFISDIKSNEKLHLLGLYSNGGVHSHKEHLHLLLKKITLKFQGEILLHIITDGRDVGPKSSLKDIEDLSAIIAKVPNCKIATISGRFFAMDRDNRWERIEKAHSVITEGVNPQSCSPYQYIKTIYEKGTTDEFIEPASFNGYQGIQGEDSLLIWNFREDRMRQISKSLAVKEFDSFERHSKFFPHNKTLCFTNYDHNTHLKYLFEQVNIKNHLGEVISKNNIPQLRIAETEKYAHVTYFFNAGIEEPYPLETRIMVPSPRDVKTYDQKPEMSAYEVANKVIEGIADSKAKFIVVNFANCDMVGHTGNLRAAIQAVETVDACLGRILSSAKKHNWQIIITADHGNAEQMVNYNDGTPHTSHTTYPVPVVFFNTGKKLNLISNGALCDIAPTILKLMTIHQPKEMTGNSLVEFE